MTMSRKHYREVAVLLATEIAPVREQQSESEIATFKAMKRVAKGMAHMFKEDNGQFDYQRFYEAAGLDGFDV